MLLNTLIPSLDPRRQIIAGCFGHECMVYSRGKYIKDIKSEAIKNNHNRYTKHFYIVGNTNSGKSTFINKLNKMTISIQIKNTLLMILY